MTVRVGGAEPDGEGLGITQYGSHIVIQDLLVGPLSSCQPRNQAAPKYTKHRCLALPLEGMMGCVRGGTQNVSAGTAPWIPDWTGQQGSWLRDGAWERFLKPGTLPGA